MNKLQQRLSLLSVASAIALTCFLAPPIVARTVEWTYPQRATIWHEALGPHNADANAVVEGRTFAFESRGGKRAREYDQALSSFTKAMQLAAPHISENREDVANCYTNLACFFYLRGDLGSAEQNMRVALKIAQGSNSVSPQVSDILEYLAVIQRAQAGSTRPSVSSSKYASEAENSYLLDRHLKHEANADSSHPDITNINSHLLMSYYDVGGSAAGESAVALRSAKAHVLSPPIYATTGEDSFAKMLSFAKEMIEKYTPPIIIVLEEPGLASIMGNWKVPTEIKTTASIKTKVVTKETVEGTESRSGSGEQASNVAEVPIFLCRAADYVSLYSTIATYGKTRGLSMDKFTITWPATHKQAEDLLIQLTNTARGLPKAKEQKTDKNGDYEFTDIPKGQYILFAALVTQNTCGYWVCPSPNESIQVKQVEQFPIDFTTENETPIWKKEGNSLRGLLPLAPNPASSRNQYMVPSPPPSAVSPVLVPTAASTPAAADNYGPYMGDLQRRIKRSWFPPKGLESKRVKVTFKVHSDGAMTDLSLVTSSGYAAADRAALLAIENASPFRRLPAGAPDDVGLDFTFDYNVFNGGGVGKFRNF